MKFMKKALVCLVALVLLLHMAPVNAEAATKFSVKSGSVVTLDVVMENIWGFEVESITFSNKSICNKMGTFKKPPILQLSGAGR